MKNIVDKLDMNAEECADEISNNYSKFAYESISDLKKRIKHCKNYIGRSSLNKN